MAELKLIASSLSLFCSWIEWALKLKVYVLVVNGKPIVESLIVLEYIEETWKDNPLLPEDPYEKAMAQFWEKFANEKCLFGAFDACRALGDEKEKGIETAVEFFAFLEKQLKGKKIFWWGTEAIWI
ncbi:hypothetical protein CRYUN_Cryun12cG0118800 [Craigia yunnanensis]